MKAETRFIRQIQKMASDVEFQSKHIRDGEKDFKRTRKTYVFRCYHVHNRGIQEVRLNWRHSAFQSISQRMKSAVQLCVKPGRKSSIPHLRNCLSKQRHLLPKISGFTDIICMQWTG